MPLVPPSPAAVAATPQPVLKPASFDIPGGPLDAALLAFARQSGVQLLYEHRLVQGRFSPGLHGTYPPPDALAALLADAPLTLRFGGPNVIVLAPKPARSAEGAPPQAEVDAPTGASTEVAPVVVTGTLIRGAGAGPSPVRIISRDAMDRTGKANVADALATLPQAFNGVSTPQTLLLGADGLGTNQTAATGVNLRGLGATSTLVLIDGRRVARMGLWLNPLVDAATAASDFDLRALRAKRMTLYLAASPDNLVRVAPLYNLLFQQLVDVSTRQRPRSDVQNPVLLVLDEFARLGHAGVLAHGFSFVAGYGLRILCVLQSPAQLRAEYGADLAEEIIANCGVEIAFTPKELRVATDLSDRLGSYTYAGRSLSGPAGLSSGRRSRTDSDQRRPLMLPQELLQLPKDRLIVLRAGMAPVLASKIVYHQDKAFAARRLAPPRVEALSDAEAQAGRIAAIALEVAALRDSVEDIRARVVERSMTPQEACGESPLGPDAVSLALEDVDMDSLPGEGASDAEVQAWLADYVARAGSAPAAPDIAARTAVRPRAG